MLNMQHAIILGFESTLAIHKGKSKTKPKIQGLLNRLSLYDTLNLACIYLDVFEEISLASVISESNNNILIDMSPTIKHIMHSKTLKKL